MLKQLLFILFLSNLLFACNYDKDKKYSLKWKVADNDVIIYNIKMKTVDSLSKISKTRMKVLIESLSNIYGDSIIITKDTDDLYKGLVKQLNMMSYFALIRHNDENSLKIDFITKQTKQYNQIKYLELFNKFIKKAFFKGLLKTDGHLVTEEGEAIWDPKINILFQLPSKPVSIGEFWSLNIIPEWQKERKMNFSNKVTLSDISIENGDTVALLKYDLQNTEQSGKKLGFNGNARFNISKGKWIEYEGTLSQQTTDMLSMKQTQYMKLSEISVSQYKSLLKKTQKSSLF